MIKNNIVIENAEIGFKNFSGKEGDFNPAGRRNFCIFLEMQVGTDLERDGWNVRWLEPKEEGVDRKPYLQVAVSYANIPPHIVIISHKGKTLLDQESVGILDWAEFTKVDLIIRPYNWKMHEGTKAEKSGIKAYVQSMYLTLYEDELASKYYDVPDSATDSIGGCGNCDTCDGTCGCEGHEH